MRLLQKLVIFRDPEPVQSTSGIPNQLFFKFNLFLFYLQAFQASEAPAVTPTSSNGVVNFTVNCQIHLHSENGELKRSNSNIELIPTSGSQLPIVFPGTVSMVTGSNINPGVVVKAEKDPLEMTLHSTITVKTIYNTTQHVSAEVVLHLKLLF